MVGSTQLTGKIEQHSYRYHNSNCRNISSNLVHNTQIWARASSHYAVHRINEQYSCVSILLAGIFLVMRRMVLPKWQLDHQSSNRTSLEWLLSINTKLDIRTSSSSSSRTLFIATISKVSRFLALKTVPYVPITTEFLNYRYNTQC